MMVFSIEDKFCSVCAKPASCMKVSGFAVLNPDPEKDWVAFDEIIYRCDDHKD